MKMPRLVVVNSFGPMGSTLLSSLLEKLQFTNVPMRKYGLHRYLMDEKNLNSGYMQNRLHEILIEHSKPSLRGGVSVLDRNNQTPHALTDYERVKNKIEQINSTSIQDLYYQCRNIYCDAVIYKRIESQRDWQIELTVDIHRFDAQTLYKKYQENFDDVRMIHLHRSFRGWINSLSSQAFLHPHLVNRIKFFPHMRHADYMLYESAVAQMPGMHIDFDEFFEKPIEDLAQQMADFLDVPPPIENLRHASYDLFGKLQPYEVAFTKFDDNITFLQKNTLDYFSKSANNYRMQNFLNNTFTWIRYLIDMSVYRIKTGKTPL
jgi:hypothetical protein